MFSNGSDGQIKTLTLYSDPYPNVKYDILPCMAMSRDITWPTQFLAHNFSEKHFNPTFHGTWPKSPCISRLIRRASISLLRDGHHQDQAYHFGKNYFELGVRGQDTSRNLKGSFVSIRVLLYMWGLGANTKIWLKGIELSYFNHSMFSKNVKIGLKMTVLPN